MINHLIEFHNTSGFFMINKDFTFAIYEHLCMALLEYDYTPCTVDDFLLNTKQLPSKTVVMRHDVDRKPLNALKIARLEHKLGIRSTYYFRYLPKVFLPEIIQEISLLNHEIGYHYETLSKCRGNFSEAIALFKKELDDFRQYVPVSTISMHGRPLSPWDNRDLWQQYDFKQYGIVGECYLSIDYAKVSYFSDTGRTWHPNRYNIRDHVSGHNTDHLITTADLIRFLSSQPDEYICILTHPNRWSDNTTEWLLESSTDFLINMVKKILIYLRPQKG